MAAQKGRPKVVAILLRKGFEVDRISKSGETALQKAAQFGHAEVVEVLLRAKADVNKGMNSGQHYRWQTNLAVVEILEKAIAEVDNSVS